LQRQTVVSQVKQVYYTLLQTQSALEATEESLTFLRELDRLTEQYVRQQTALKSASLNVKSQLAQTEYQALTQRHTLASQQEQLNELLGRDIRTPFRVNPVPEATPFESDAAAAQSSVAAARAQLKQAEIALGDAALKAPMDGIVLQRNIDVGSLVAAGTVGFALADVRAVKVVFGVPDLMLRTIQLGGPLAITTDVFPGREFPGRVTAISPAADPQSRIFNIEVTVPNPQDQLKSGMVAALQVSGGELPEPTPVVPLSAIVRPKDNPAGYAVFVIDAQDGREIARLRHVKVGAVYGDMIAVPEGVRVGERVISTGTTLLGDGDQVRVIP
jgi:RND family efflux transporter MFP subunit